MLSVEKAWIIFLPHHTVLERLASAFVTILKVFPSMLKLANPGS